jgi:hypothetical protein
VTLSIKKYFKNLYKRCECGYCDCLIPIINKRSNFARFKHNHHAKGKNKYNFKGVKKTKKGYMVVYKHDHPNASKAGYVYLHVYVFTKFYKCCMLPWGIVHHINEKKLDNRISLNPKYNNLQGMTRSQHSILHREGKIMVDMNDRICSNCNSNETYINKKGRPVWFDFMEKFECSKCHDIRRKKKKISYNQHSLEAYV